MKFELKPWGIGLPHHFKLSPCSGAAALNSSVLVIYTTGQVPGNCPRHLDAFPEGSVQVMVPKRLNDALVQLQSCSSPADAFESVSWTVVSV
jgi:hypothetical protein